MKDLENKKEVYELADKVDCNLIKVVYKTKKPVFSNVQIFGFHVPTFDATVGEVIWSKSILKFCPDEKGVLWGYVFDIEENRKNLAQLLGTGNIMIVDKAIEKEVFEIARANNFKTEPPKRTYGKTRPILVKPEAIEEEIKKKYEREIETLKKQLEELKTSKGSNPEQQKFVLNNDTARKGK